MKKTTKKRKISLENFISSSKKQVTAYVKTDNRKPTPGFIGDDFEMWNMNNSPLPKNFEDHLGILMGDVKWKTWKWDGNLKEIEGKLTDFDGNQITSITAR